MAKPPSHMYMPTGYIESVKQLREQLLIQEWDMSNRHLAKKRWAYRDEGVRETGKCPYKLAS